MVRVILVFTATILALVMNNAASAADKKPQPPLRLKLPTNLTDAQKKILKEIESGPRKKVPPVFDAMIRNPDLADMQQKLGLVVLKKNSLPARIREFAMCILATHWNSQWEFHVHSKGAIKDGMNPQVLADLAKGTKSTAMKPDEAAVYDFTTELIQTKMVSDATYKALTDKVGENGVVDLVAVLGYWSWVSMMQNVMGNVMYDGSPAPLSAK